MIVLVVLASVGGVMRAKVEATLKANLRSVLETTLRTEETALRGWMRMQRNQAEFAAADDRVVKNIQALIASLPKNATSLEILNLPQTAELRGLLDLIQKSQKYDGMPVVEPNGRVLSATRNAPNNLCHRNWNRSWWRRDLPNLTATAPPEPANTAELAATVIAPPSSVET